MNISEIAADELIGGLSAYIHNFDEIAAAEPKSKVLVSFGSQIYTFIPQYGLCWNCLDTPSIDAEEVYKSGILDEWIKKFGYGDGDHFYWVAGSMEYFKNRHLMKNTLRLHAAIWLRNRIVEHKIKLNQK